jgi:hypothetical protein
MVILYSVLVLKPLLYLPFPGIMFRLDFFVTGKSVPTFHCGRVVIVESLDIEWDAISPGPCEGS